MNVFVAGVQGVGKTHLSSRIPASLGLTHTSASKLIKEERAMLTWGTDVRVSEVDANQAALSTEVSRHNSAGFHLLLDGHFVLLDLNNLVLRPSLKRSERFLNTALAEAEQTVIYLS